MRLFAEEARAWQHAATPFVLLFVVGIPFAFAAILRYDPDPNPNLNPTPKGRSLSLTLTLSLSLTLALALALTLTKASW